MYNHPDSNRKFEKFLSHDISLIDTSQSSITMFYNDLRTISVMYDIFLIPFDEIVRDQPLHDTGFLATPPVINKMSSQLFYKLKQAGVLPGNESHF